MAQSPKSTSSSESGFDLSHLPGSKRVLPGEGRRRRYRSTSSDSKKKRLPVARVLLWTWGALLVVMMLFELSPLELTFIPLRRALRLIAIFGFPFALGYTARRATRSTSKVKPRTVGWIVGVLVLFLLLPLSFSLRAWVMTSPWMTTRVLYRHVRTSASIQGQTRHVPSEGFHRRVARSYGLGPFLRLDLTMPEAEAELEPPPPKFGPQWEWVDERRDPFQGRDRRPAG